MDDDFGFKVPKQPKRVPFRELERKRNVAHRALSSITIITVIAVIVTLVVCIIRALNGDGGSL